VEQHIGDTSRDALKWLETKQDPWLLVFDNADDPGINLNGFIPQCDHGNILITSRNPGLCVYAGADSLVSDMEESDAVVLLLKCALQDMSPANQQTATKIVKVYRNHFDNDNFPNASPGLVLSCSRNYSSWSIHSKVWGPRDLFGFIY
jgi:hypothetical protein